MSDLNERIEDYKVRFRSLEEDEKVLAQELSKIISRELIPKLEGKLPDGMKVGGIDAVISGGQVDIQVYREGICDDDYNGLDTDSINIILDPLFEELKDKYHLDECRFAAQPED